MPKSIEDMSREELLALARQKGLDGGGIMEVGEGEADDDDISTADPRGTGTAGTRVPAEQPSARVSGAESVRPVGYGLPSEGRGGSPLRREPGAPAPGGVAEGHPPGDTGERERLAPEPLIPGATDTSKPRDIILSPSVSPERMGASSRFDANLDAIRTLKTIEADNRQATPQEQTTIARYSGFGDSTFNPAFDRYRRDDIWNRRGEQLREVTTGEEYEAIERSRLTAFYTTPEIINTMWSGLQKLGADDIAHPRILEPAAGSGRFLGYQPPDMAARSTRTAVELDDLTGRMLRQTYPDTEVYVTGYQNAPVAPGSVDIAISNVPFGDFPVNDPAFPKGRRHLTRQIHNYFFAKTLDNLRPGGMLAFITSHYTLDAPKAEPIRKSLAEQADLVAAIRLPKTAFPDTEVATDIVFMRKRLPDEKPGDQSWVHTGEIDLKTGESTWDTPITVPINQYFLDHPEMVAGQHAATGSMYRRGEYTVEPFDRPLAETIGGAIQRLPAGLLKNAPAPAPRAQALPTPANVHEGARVVGDDGKIRINRRGMLTDAELSEAEAERVRHMLRVRDAGREVLGIQLRAGTTDELKKAQAVLNETYEEFAVQHGALSASHNTELLKDDPDAPFLRALENWDTASKDVQKAKTLSSSDADRLKMDIFNQRVVKGLEKVKAVSDESGALAVVLNETGRLDLNRMGELLGQAPDKVRDSLAQQGMIFKNPVGDWEPADQYLTGDVREKLRTAQIAATGNPMYAANVQALEAVQPPDLTPSQISVRLGSPWVPSSDVDDFVRDTMRPYSSWRGEQGFFRYVPATGEWVKTGRIDAAHGTLTSEYGTQRLPGDQIILRLLNGKPIEVMDRTDDDKSVRNPQETVAAQEKADVLRKAFQEWIWADPERSRRLTELYNNTFNTHRPRIFDGSHQALPGMHQEWARIIHPHQKDAIWRVVQDRNALLAHEVGFGKTAVMVGAGMELRRLGLSRKNLYIVPKATHKQFRDQFQDIYPFAKILYPSDDDFTPSKRPEFIARAATGDWDAVILSDSQFRRIPIKPETEVAFLHEEIIGLRAALEAEGESQGDAFGRQRAGKSASHKQIQKALIKAETRLAETMAKVGAKAEHTMHFEDIGVDRLFVDEADMFKNLRFATKMGRLKGLPNTDSERAWDMYSKTRYLQDQGQGVVFATGTPVANTIAEMYTMMRYLQRPMLEAKGMEHFDAWARTFGETTESLEQTPTGAYRLTQRFAKFSNAPELSNIWQQVADIRVADEVPAITRQRPRLVDDEGKARRSVISTPPDDVLLSYMQHLAKRADELHNVDPREDNMLKIANDARMASLDMRMVVPSAPANPDGKIAIAARKIADLHRETTPDRGAQLVFLDIGTPKARDKETELAAAPEETDTAEEQQALRNVYAVIRDHLIASGVPKDDIAFIHDAKNQAQRTALYGKVNRGDIRVLIGSTGKLGVGVNVQERAAALHHLDAPWRPRDIEQREGRVIRQGNKVYGPTRDAEGKITGPGPGVRVFTYVTERSFDAYMWQAIEAKSKAIKAIMRRDSPPRNIEDIDSLTMSAGEAKAVASGNPDILKAVSLKNDTTRLQMLRASHLDSQVRAREELESLPSKIQGQEEVLAAMKQDDESAKAAAEKFSMMVKGQRLTERTGAGELLAKIIKETPEVPDPENNPDVAEYKGFGVRIIDQGPGTGYKLILRRPETGHDYPVAAIAYGDLTPAGVVQRIENKVKGIPADIEARERALDKFQANLATYTTQAAKAFEHEDRLGRMQAEMIRLEKKLQGEEVGPEIAGAAEPLDGEPLPGEKPTYRFADEPEARAAPAAAAPREPTERQAEDRAAYGRTLDSQPRGATFTVPDDAGPLSGTWTKTEKGAESFWVNQAGEHKTSAEFHTARDVVEKTLAFAPAPPVADVAPTLAGSGLDDRQTKRELQYIIGRMHRLKEQGRLTESNVRQLADEYAQRHGKPQWWLARATAIMNHMEADAPAQPPTAPHPMPAEQPGTLETAALVDKVKFELWKTAEGGGRIRVVDEDSGEVIGGITTHPAFGDAETAHAALVAKAQLMATPSLKAYEGMPYHKARGIIAEDQSLTFEEKRAALQALARERAAEVTAPPAAEEKPKRVRFDRGSLSSAIEAAQKLKADAPVYVVPTTGGYAIAKREPPAWFKHTRVDPDGSTETVTPPVIREAEAAPAPPTEPRPERPTIPQPDKFYLRDTTGTPIETEGSPVHIKGWEDQDFFVHRGFGPHADKWVVTEGSTGSAISLPADTKEAAIENTTERLAKATRDQYEKMLGNAVQRWGTTPRYQAPTTAPPTVTEPEPPVKPPRRRPPVKPAAAPPTVAEAEPPVKPPRERPPVKPAAAPPTVAEAEPPVKPAAVPEVEKRRVKVTRPPAGAAVTISGLRRAHEERSDRAQAIDESKLARTVVTPREGERWLRRPNRVDVRGIDTPRAAGTMKRIPRAPKPPKPGPGRGSGLRSVKKGRQFETRGHGGRLISRRPLGPVSRRP